MFMLGGGHPALYGLYHVYDHVHVIVYVYGGGGDPGGEHLPLAGYEWGRQDGGLCLWRPWGTSLMEGPSPSV